MNPADFKKVQLRQEVKAQAQKYEQMCWHVFIFTLKLLFWDVCN